MMNVNLTMTGKDGYKFFTVYLNLTVAGNNAHNCRENEGRSNMVASHGYQKWMCCGQLLMAGKHS